MGLYGEGDYILTNIKEIDVTDGFLSLDDTVKKCQDEKTLLDCKKEKYVEMGEKICKCIPHHLKQFSVNFLNIHGF